MFASVQKFFATDHRDMFDWAVRHEVGHSVDAQMRSGKKNTDAVAQWVDYGSDSTRIALALVDTSGGAISKLGGSKRVLVLKALAKAIGGRKKFTTALEEVTKGPPPPADALTAGEQEAVLADDAIKALAHGRAGSAPWEAPFKLGNSGFHEQEPGKWVSYAYAARAKQVSNYQFRAPGEWFAEAYAYYFKPVSKSQERGHFLKEKDPGTWAWMQANIDTVGRPDEKKRD
jgi:hypothetical protein